MTNFDDSNPKTLLILAIFIFMSRMNFMLSWVEQEKSFIISGPGIFHTIFIKWAFDVTESDDIVNKRVV